VTGPGQGELAENYAAAGFGRALELGRRPALVLVDLVEAYFNPEAEFYMGDDACLASASGVLQAARDAGVPVIHTRVSFAAGGVDGGPFFRKIKGLAQFVGDTPLGAIRPEVAPLPNEIVIIKQYASAFFGTSLSSTLTGLGVDTLIIVGVSTSGCIRATAVDTIQHGFVPVVVRPAENNRSPGPHEANLFDMQAKYAEVLDEDTVKAYLATVGSA